MPRRHPHPRPHRVARAGLMLVAAFLLLATPAAVVILASGETVAAPSAAERASSRDPLRPSAPFFAGEGDGVRPDGIGCQRADGTALRARAHLDVFIDGAPLTVPAGLGVRPQCRYWLRTEAADGIVQIRSPERRTFRLGDLFDIWGAPLTPTRVLGVSVGDGHRLRAFVDGRRVTGDPRRIAIQDGREIALVIGRAPARVPHRFTFG